VQILSTITAKGQTTVPIEIRRALGLGPREKIVYQIDGDVVRIKAARGSLLESAGALADDQPAQDRARERSITRQARGQRYRANA